MLPFIILFTSSFQVSETIIPYSFRPPDALSPKIKGKFFFDLLNSRLISEIYRLFKKCKASPVRSLLELFFLVQCAVPKQKNKTPPASSSIPTPSSSETSQMM